MRMFADIELKTFIEIHGQDCIPLLGCLSGLYRYV
jgi:hypothetical protein